MNCLVNTVSSSSIHFQCFNMCSDQQTSYSDVSAVRSGTFWILVLIAEGMVVGETNWKEGAALLGYWAGNLTTRWTWWLPKWAETTQLRFMASIWEQTDVSVRLTGLHIHLNTTFALHLSESHLHVDISDLQVDQRELLLQCLSENWTRSWVLIWKPK